MTGPAVKTDSLSYQLLSAAQAVSLVLNGTALPQAINDVATFSIANRGAIQDLSYRTLRQLGRVDALIKVMASKTPKPPLLYSLLATSLAQIVDDDTSHHPYAEFTVVDQAVRAAGTHRELAHAKPFINALLRRFLRERASLLHEVMASPQARWNFPDWWITECQTSYPNTWQSVLATSQQHPPLTLRINQRRTSIPEYLALLQKEGLAGEGIGPYAVRLKKAIPVQQLPGFDNGLVSVQDAAAQLAAPLLDVHDGMRVLDACAAPGGKTCHLLETAHLHLSALDSDPKRLQKVADNCARLQLSAQLIEGDATTRNWWDGQLFDRVLADVPCTASGITRRHPDIPWLRRPSDAAQLATLSARILDNLWSMTKPGGKLLLVTCSIWPNESEEQAKAFEKRHRAKRLDAPGQLLPTAEARVDHDGLFFALFQKPIHS